MMVDYLTIRERYKRNEEPINWFLPTTFAVSSLVTNEISYFPSVHLYLYN